MFHKALYIVVSISSASHNSDKVASQIPIHSVSWWSGYEKLSMKLTLALVLVMSTWVMLMSAATSSEVTKSKSPPPPKPIQLNLGLISKQEVLKANYSEVLKTFRVELKDPNRRPYFGIPMLRKPSGREHSYAKIVSAKGNPIELAINKSNAYLVGYSYTYENEVRARFFKDVIDGGESTGLFPKAKNVGKQNIGYNGIYSKIQEKAGIPEAHEDRREVKLGMVTLGSYIDQIGKPPQSNFAKNEARLLLIAIQMVCEAVRFKYIEKQVNDNIPNDFNPDFKVISLERNWGAISEAIARVKTEIERFKNDLQLKDAQNNVWVVQNAKGIKDDMGLLKYVDPSKPKCQLDDDVLVRA